MSHKLKAFALVAFSFFFADAALAQDCGSLKQMASLRITTLPDGNIAIPASVEGHDGLFIVTMDGARTKVSAEVLDQLSIGRRDLPSGSAIEGSKAIFTVPNFKIANLDIKATPVLWLDQKPKQDGVIGYIGTDLLGMFDIELDLAHAKLNLFSPDHCPGHVVYWTNSVAAAIPFSVGDIGDIRFEAQLDGKLLQVALTTKPGYGVIEPDLAHDVLGYEIPQCAPVTIEVTSDVKAALDAVAALNAPVALTFKTLTIGNITISNPKIAVAGLSGLPKCDGKPHTVAGMLFTCKQGAGFRLGLAELSALRLYFAFHEKNLYVTAADAAR